MKKYSTIFDLIGSIFLLLSAIMNDRTRKIIAASVATASFAASLVITVIDLLSDSCLEDEESGDDDLPDDLLFED